MSFGITLKMADLSSVISRVQSQMDVQTPRLGIVFGPKQQLSLTKLSQTDLILLMKT